MKKFTRLMLSVACLCFTIGAFAQPTAAPAVPTKPISNVISLYGSDTYTPIVGVKSFEDWGQTQRGSTIGDYTIPGTVHKVLKYGKLSFQGIDFSDNKQDVSGMKYLHMDIWTADATSTPLWIAMISGNQNIALEKTITTAGSWFSLDIPLTEYVGSTLTSINQLMFTSNEWRTYATNTTSSTIYLDNIYYWTDVTPTILVSTNALTVEQAANSTKTFDITAATTWTVASDQTWLTPSATSGSGNATITLTATANTLYASRAANVTVTASDNSTKVVVVTQTGLAIPAAPTPTVAEANVKVIFSDAYTPVAATFQDWYGTTMTEESSNVVANKVKKISSVCCFGYAFPVAVDMSAMTKLHLDVFPTTATALTLGIVANGEHKVNKTLIANQWNTIDLTLADLTSSANLAAVAQVGFWDLGGVFYFDNLLFYSGTYTVGTAVSTVAAENGIRCFPSKVSTNMTVTANSTIREVTILTLVGQMVQSTTVNAKSKSVDLSTLATGNYLVRVTMANGQIATQKVIKL